MKESLIDIAGTIEKSLSVFRQEGIIGSMAARVHGVFDNKEDTYWFSLCEFKTVFWGKTNLKALGHIVSKNTNIAVRILNEELGSSIEYVQKNNLHREEKHCIIAENRSDLFNRHIAIAGDSQLYFYDNIYDFLCSLQQESEKIVENERLQKEKEKQIEELKKQENTSIERGILTKGLNKLKEEHLILTKQKEAMNNLTRFIRKQNELRYNPILDKVQNRIKTGNLFNGTTLIINGGPGTGKTTTMIQRLKYLTDIYAINEDFDKDLGLYNLSDTNRKKLLDAIGNEKDWLFFSPSELLREYLKNAMDKEGLSKIDNKVHHWREFCNARMINDYHLIVLGDDNTPFKASKSEEILIYQCVDAIHDFENFFVNQLRTIKDRLPKIDRGDVMYKWSAIALGIRDHFDNVSEMNLTGFIMLFNSLESAYSKDCRELIKENKDTIKSVSEELSVMLSNDKDKRHLVETILLNNNDVHDDIDDETEENEEEITDRITALIRQWFRRYCYKSLNKDVILTQRQQRLNDLLLPLLSDRHKLKVGRVGELVLFEQFAKYTRGAKSIILGGFPSKYKRFRRSMYTTHNSGWNQVVLEELITKKGGKGLHFQERSLIVGFINNLVKSLIRFGTNDLSHDYIQAYQYWSRPIIGVDEATDFCECDIYAMESFLTIDYNSITLCGDMMQRLTGYGIKSWASIENIVSKPIIVDLKTSYRQSLTLLNVASRLYKDTLGNEPNYKAHMDSTKVPKPLAFVSNDEREKINWIVKRINEVYLAYGKHFPSIAIFLNDKNDIPAFVDNLNDTDFIEDADIKVLDGSFGNVLATGSQIRVYPINVVKGMEFDVVFFHNIDKSILNNELMQRYIYVGISRAAFFLGVTLMEKNDAICKYFEMNQQWNKNNLL